MTTEGAAGVAVGPAVADCRRLPSPSPPPPPPLPPSPHQTEPPFWRPPAALTRARAPPPHASDPHPPPIQPISIISPFPPSLLAALLPANVCFPPAPCFALPLFFFSVSIPAPAPLSTHARLARRVPLLFHADPPGTRAGARAS